MGKDKRIVITGIGLITHGGVGKTKVWQAIKDAKTGLKLQDYEIDNVPIGQYYIHKINNFDINSFGINRELLYDIRAWKENEEDIDLNYLMASVKLALDDSHLTVNESNNKSIGLILCQESPGTYSMMSKIMQEFIHVVNKETCFDDSGKKKDFFLNFYRAFDKTVYETQTFMFLYHIAKTFNIHGFSLFINNSCSSGLYALETASILIKEERNKVMIVAAEDNINIFKQLWFNKLNMYAHDGKTRPFDKDACGFVLGDAAVGIVLEDMEHAMARNAPIYAEYIGGAFVLEGWKIAVPDVIGNSYHQVMTDAFSKANIGSDEIDLVCTHGLGTKITDRYEARAISEVFAQRNDHVLVTAFKPLVGHTLSAAALLETAVLILAMKDNFVPPVLNTQVVDKQIDKNLVMKPKRIELNKTLKISCGFAGFNAACIFQKVRSNI